MKFDKICILGLGYIGLPTASMFAVHGVKVIGVDVNPHVVKTLRLGEAHINNEPGLHEVVRRAIESGCLFAQETPELADAFVIAVPTPIRHDKTADMGMVTAAAHMIAPHLRPGNLVILESTSPPRTTIDLVKPILETSGLKAGQDFLLAYSPERVLPGQILREIVENARVIGGIDPASAEAGCDLYSIFVRGDIMLTDATTAEMVKLMENTFRDVNIALANEFALVAECIGVNVWEAIDLANRHPRVKILRPGPGVGGHCIAVDPWFLAEAAPSVTPLIRRAREVNDGMPARVVNQVCRALNLNGASVQAGLRIACLGLAYKADVDDARESPAVEVVNLLRQVGFEPRSYDPYVVMGSVDGQVDTLDAALDGAKAVVILTDHRVFKNIPREVLVGAYARPVIDPRNVLDLNVTRV